MNPAVYTAIGAVAGAIVTAVASVIVVWRQRRDDQAKEQRRRAFAAHAEKYETIFSKARSVQDALHDFMSIERRRSSLHDPFLEMLLEILRSACDQFCVAVDWRHSPDMVYVTLKLEKRAFAVRELILEWLSRPHLKTKLATYHVSNGVRTPVNGNPFRGDLRSCDEILVLSQSVVIITGRDRQIAAALDKSLDRLIRDLKILIT